MKKSSLVFGSILLFLGLLYGLNTLGIIGDGIFSLSFVFLIIGAPILSEKFNEGSAKEYIVKGVFAGCILLTMFLDLGLVFNLIMVGIILISGIIMIFFDSLKSKLLKK